MMVRIFWLGCAAVLAAASVPWYWPYLPWDSDTPWLGVTLDVWVSGSAAVALLLGILATFGYQEHRKRQTIRSARAKIDSLRGRAHVVETQLVAVRGEYERATASHEAQLSGMQAELEVQRDELAGQRQAWDHERRRAEITLERQKSVHEERSARLAAEIQEFERERNHWEQHWRQQEHELAAQLNKFESASARWKRERERRTQELDERKQELETHKLQLDQLRDEFDEQRWQWHQQRRTEELELQQLSDSLELQRKELQLKIKATDQRLDERARMLIDREDQLARNELTWEEQRAEEHLRLDQWHDELRATALELQRTRERSEHEIARRVVRLEQQEAKLSASEKAFQFQLEQWELQKRRWENELAARSEQLHRKAPDDAHAAPDDVAVVRLPATPPAPRKPEPSSKAVVAIRGLQHSHSPLPDQEHLTQPIVVNGPDGETISLLPIESNHSDAVIEWAQIDTFDDESPAPHHPADQNVQPPEYERTADKAQARESQAREPQAREPQARDPESGEPAQLNVACDPEHGRDPNRPRQHSDGQDGDAEDVPATLAQAEHEHRANSAPEQTVSEREVFQHVDPEQANAGRGVAEREEMGTREEVGKHTVAEHTVAEHTVAEHTVAEHTVAEHSDDPVADESWRLENDTTIVHRLALLGRRRKQT